MAIDNIRKRAEKVKAQTKYTEVNKRVERNIRNNKQKNMEYLSTTEEKARREGSIIQSYDNKETSNEL